MRCGGVASATITATGGATVEVRIQRELWDLTSYNLSLVLAAAAFVYGGFMYRWFQYKAFVMKGVVFCGDLILL